MRSPLHGWENGVWNCIQPLPLDPLERSHIQGKASQLIGNVKVVRPPSRASPRGAPVTYVLSATSQDLSPTSWHRTGRGRWSKSMIEVDHRGRSSRSIIEVDHRATVTSTGDLDRATSPDRASRTPGESPVSSA
jgi:hypothetical protein